MQLQQIVAFLFCMENEMECCVEVCTQNLDANYWNTQYANNTIGWDLGQVSPPIKSYFDDIKDKDLNILIPGCGNAYEASFLLDNGFTNITIIDIAKDLVHKLKQQFKNTSINVVEQDFFALTESFDIIIEQTFFCALPPTKRQEYVYKMHQLLKPNGKLIGLLFNRQFEKNPPFGGSQQEYEALFKDAFYLQKIMPCENSIKPRENTELFIEFVKQNNVIVTLYKFTGITCIGCKNTVTSKFLSIQHVLNVSMSTNFDTVLVVSSKPININLLQEAIAYDNKYNIAII